MFKDDRFAHYNAAGFRRDMVAGITVGIVAIPLGMAFAIASGVKPEYGLYTTIIAGFLVALLGGSRYQVAGPTGAFIPILLAIVLQYGYEDLLIAGFLAGIFLLIMSVLGVSQLIQFVPRSVTIGFTAGIAVIIFSGQIANFFGLTDVKKYEYFHQNMLELWHRASTYNGYSIALALIGFATILLVTKFAKRLPVLLVALVVPTAISVLFFDGKVDTIGTAFGGIPSALPSFIWPQITFEKVMYLWQPALIIAALGAIESLLSTVVADEMTHTKHNAKRELFGQGIANMVTPLFGGIPATGAIARTATNIRSGGVSPVSSMVQSVFVLLFVVLLGPYASYIPLAAMAPILMHVSWNMVSRDAFMQIGRVKSGDAVVLWVTFLLTIFVDLTTAVQVGILLAAVFFLKKMIGELRFHVVAPTAAETSQFGSAVTKCVVKGPLFFGTAKRFEEAFPDWLTSDILLLDCAGVSALDATGEAALVSLVARAQEEDIRLIIKKLPLEQRSWLKRSGLYTQIGEHNFYNA